MTAATFRLAKAPLDPWAPVSLSYDRSKNPGECQQNYTYFCDENLGLLILKLSWDGQNAVARFKLHDNDPAEKGADPSNRDSNKGLLSLNSSPMRAWTLPGSSTSMCMR